MGRADFRFRNKLYVFIVAITTIINFLITSRYVGGKGGLVLWYTFILLTKSTENYGREMTLYKKESIIQFTRSALGPCLNKLQGKHAVVRCIQGLQ